MKKLLLIVFSFVMVFSFTLSVKADCSYKERTNMLNEAKGVEVFFEPNFTLNEFRFYMYNLTDNIYATIESSNTAMVTTVYNTSYTGDYYYFDVPNGTNVVTYKISIYSKNMSCYGNKLLTKTVKKGIINKYADTLVCEGAEEFKYCQKVFDKDLTISDEEMLYQISQYKTSNTVVDTKDDKYTLISFFTKYWYFFAIGLGLIVISIIIFKIVKKRGELD